MQAKPPIFIDEQGRATVTNPARTQLVPTSSAQRLSSSRGLVPIGSATPVEQFTKEQIRAARAATDARLAPLSGASTQGAAPSASASPASATPNQQPVKPSVLNRLSSAIRDNPRKAIGGTVLSTALEAPTVLDAFQRGGAVEGLKQVGRSGLKVAGGIGGGALGLLAPPGAQIATIPALSVAGNAAGKAVGNFVFGEGLVDGRTESGPSKLAQAVRTAAAADFSGRARPGGTTTSILPEFLGGNNQPRAIPAQSITSPIGTTGPTSRGSARRTAGGSAQAGQSPSEVLSTFTGSDRRTQAITRSRANDLAAQLPTVSITAGGDTAARQQNGRAAQFQARRPSASGLSSVSRQIDATIAGLGELNMRSKRALVGQLLDAKARLASGQFNTEAGIGTNDASIAQRQAGDLLSADTSSTNARLGRAQTVVGADGALRTLDPANPASLTPVTDAAGNPIFTPQRSSADPQAKFQNDALLKLIQGQANQIGGDGINEQQLQEQLDAIKRLSSGGGAGLQQIGTDSKTGNPVFRDANGNLVTK